jgi:hypothetical protein
MLGQARRAHRRRRPSEPDQPLTELTIGTAFRSEAQPLTQCGVVAQFGVGIQRQVIGQQADVMPQQGRQATPFHAGDRDRLVLPEVAVMHQYQVSLPGDRLVEQRLTSGDAAHHPHDSVTAFDLQAVEGVVLEARR